MLNWIKSICIKTSVAPVQTNIWISSFAMRISYNIFIVCFTEKLYHINLKQSKLKTGRIKFIEEDICLLFIDSCSYCIISNKILRKSEHFLFYKVIQWIENFFHFHFWKSQSANDTTIPPHFHSISNLLLSSPQSNYFSVFGAREVLLKFHLQKSNLFIEEEIVVNTVFHFIATVYFVSRPM